MKSFLPVTIVHSGNTAHELFALSLVQWLETAEMYIVTLLKYYLGQVQKSGMLCSLYIAVNDNELPL